MPRSIARMRTFRLLSKYKKTPVFMNFATRFILRTKYDYIEKQMNVILISRQLRGDV